MYSLLYLLFIIIFTQRILPIQFGSIDDIYNTGIDERVKPNTDVEEDNYTLLNIQSYMHKKSILDILTREDISIHTKLYIYNENKAVLFTPIPPLYNACLDNDWNFVF
jgi:hypothetical protein